ncbi:MAG: N-6 DNA methylase, partial [Cyanobacteria bacterium HKST-UBA03]|nr:N-6 DNA methylase [Cyanobacteria bacterium HKST-UBA03]
MTRRRTPKKATSAATTFDTLTLEGAILSPALIDKVNQREVGDQTEKDYAIPKGLTLRDELARYFRVGQALFNEFSDKEVPSASATTMFIQTLFRDVFGFNDIGTAGVREREGHQYKVSLEALGGRVPLVVVPPSDTLDRASEALYLDRRQSAATAIQDWLNADEDSLWGFCTNGEKLRLVRDNASLTRPAYLEFNLKELFEGEKHPDFTLMWLLFHHSRFGEPGTPVTDCALERWREQGSKEGIAARDRLRDGVEQALLALGNGFLQHPKNTTLRQRISAQELSLQDYFTQLLRLVYRLIFLLVAEDNAILFAPDATAQSRSLYTEGYSLSHLRAHAIRRAAWDNYADRWEGLCVVFGALAHGEPRLGLPALGGLFADNQLPELTAAALSNKTLMEAVYRLAWIKEDHRLLPINWKDMETEELGSVYESLLELTPRLNGTGHDFSFAEGAEGQGHARKTTGSYYTPDALVQVLLDSALDPVLDRAEAQGSDPVEALLNLTVVDPACGSGHFLLGAARRIASRVARLRAEGVASAEEFRHALREVIRRCIYGVDRNPMAVELTKVALWIESVEPGKPLGFLDAHIRCGDSLVGVLNPEMLAEGIPDEAYKPLTGDDKDTCKALKQLNKENSKGVLKQSLFATVSSTKDSTPIAELEAMPEETLAQIDAERAAWQQAVHAPQREQERWKADLLVAA